MLFEGGDASLDAAREALRFASTKGEALRGPSGDLRGPTFLEIHDAIAGDSSRAALLQGISKGDEAHSFGSRQFM